MSHEALYPREAAVIAERGQHPDEALPRSETFIHERDSWARDVARLEKHAEKLRRIELAARTMMGLPPSDPRQQAAEVELVRALAVDGIDHNHADPDFKPETCPRCAGKPLPV